MKIDYYDRVTNMKITTFTDIRKFSEKDNSEWIYFERDLFKKPTSRLYHNIERNDKGITPCWTLIPNVNYDKCPTCGEKMPPFVRALLI